MSNRELNEIRLLPQYAFERNGEVHHYYRVDDVKNAFSAPASPAPSQVPAELSDERILEIIARIGSSSLNVTRVHELGGKTSTMMEDEGVIEFARSIERELRAGSSDVREQAQDPEYELIQNDELVAGTSGKDAFNEILRYAAQYVQDGPVELYKVVRTKIEIPAASKEGDTQ